MRVLAQMKKRKIWQRNGGASLICTLNYRIILIPLFKLGLIRMLIKFTKISSILRKQNRSYQMQYIIT